MGHGNLAAQRSVYASGVYPQSNSRPEKKLNIQHRVPVLASVDVATGEVRFSVDPAAIEILRRDTNGH